MLFESHEGRGTLCSPLTIYRALRADPRFASFRFAWSLADDAAVAAARADLGDDDRTEYVRRDSVRLRQLAGTAQYVVNNHGFPSWFATQPDQTYVNTWHGVPLKLIGFDVRDGALAIRSTLRNFLNADVLVSAGPAATERLIHGAYRLRDLYGGDVLELGTPRIDDQFAADPDRVRERLAAAGAALDAGRRTVLLAPTWRGRNFRSPRSDAVQLARRVAALRAGLGPDWQVLVKPHHVTGDAAASVAPELAPNLVPFRIPVNEVLALADVVVSDYSSVIVDALATDRPLVLHRPDEASYVRERGLYPTPDLPGPVTRTDAELVAAVRAVGSGSDADPTVSHAAGYAGWKDRWAPYEDGRATERLIDAVFARPRPVPTLAPPAPDRERVLIYLGGLLTNGVTASALALLRGIDHSRYAVFPHFEYKRDEQDWGRVAELPPEVVPLIRTGPLVAPDADKAALDAWLADPGVAPEVAVRARVVLEYEWRRCFGRSRFEHVIDFSGYAPLWAAKLTAGPPAQRSIWLHNDMAAEADNVAKRDRPWLRQVFARYPDYDAVVSVSPELARRNADALATPATRSRFTAVANLVDAGRVRQLAYGPAGSAPPPELDPTPDDPWTGLAALLQSAGAAAVRAEINRLELLRRTAPDGPVTTFVTLGRLSLEKNQRRLIEAFARVHADTPASRLLIAGDGDLRAELTERAADLDLVDAVSFLGHLANPYPVLAAADCFVLSSDYEGLPMTVLEARVLGVPVLCTRFATVESAVPPGTGLVVERSVPALAEGLRAAIRGEIPVPAFDPEEWNDRARAELDRVFAGVSAPTATLVPLPAGA